MSELSRAVNELEDLVLLARKPVRDFTADEKDFYNEHPIAQLLDPSTTAVVEQIAGWLREQERENAGPAMGPLEGLTDEEATAYNKAMGFVPEPPDALPTEESK